MSVNFIQYLVHISACISFQFMIGRLVMDYRVWLKIQLLMRLMENQKKIPFKGVKGYSLNFIIYESVGFFGFGVLVSLPLKTYVCPNS